MNQKMSIHPTIRVAYKPSFLLLLLLGACSSHPEFTPAPTVDLDRQIIFHNGTILTMDPDNPQAAGLEVRGEKIQAIGSGEEILVLAEPGATLIDLQGATLMPGFVDAHSHIFNDAEQHMAMSFYEVQQLALANGITTLGDLYVDKGFLKDIQEFDAAGVLQIHTNLYLLATDNCGRLLGDWWKEHRTSHNPGEMLRIGGVKIFTDGGSCEYAARSYEMTPGDNPEALFFNQEERNGLVAEVEKEGWQVALHASGDLAVRQAQNAIEAALNGEPNDNRHRIDHNSAIPPELLPRYSEIGILPVIYGHYPTCFPEYGPPPEEFRSWEWPWRALLDASPSLPIAWHSDDPWNGRVRPLDDLYSFRTRDGVADDGTTCLAPDWQQQHTITVEEALPMMTINAAYALFREEEVGSLIPGKIADLIILSYDPLAATSEEILEMEVLMTMVGGQTVHCKEDQSVLCPE